MSIPSLRSIYFLPIVLAPFLGCQQGTVVQIASGFDLLPLARPALAENGVVLAMTASTLVQGDGVTSSTLDLAGSDLAITAATPTHPARVRDAGDIVFVANRSGVPGCPGNQRGAYRTTMAGGAITTLFENCPALSDEGKVGEAIALSLNGTVAFSQIRNGKGSLYRGPVLGAMASLRTGNGIFYNTRSLDVNDAGQVAIQMEYTDGSAGGLMRGILVFATPEQAREATNTAIEKMGIGVQPEVAMNSSGTVVFSLNGTVTFPIAGTVYSFGPGVYRATPTLFNTPKDLTLIADLSGPYCRFGAVDINDSDKVVFEAAIDGELGCGSAGLVPSFDGLFQGPNPGTDYVVRRGDPRLAGHQYFDSIYLGEVNNAGQVSFSTTYSEPLVDPVSIWRWSPL